MNSSSGKISVDTLETRTGEIDVSSGDIELGRVKAVSMKMELSSGELQVDSLDSDRTDIRTSADTILASARGDITFRGSSGDIEIEFSALDAAVELDVSSGDITLIIPEGSAFDASLDTSSGRIRSEFSILGDLSADGDEVRGTVNGGGLMLDARTSSGDIKLLAR